MNDKPKILIAKNYRSFIENLLGSEAWRHLYVESNGEVIDITENGENSCAYMLSSVLIIFGLAQKAHATITSTVEDMKKYDWHEVQEPFYGCVVEWDGHIGFYIDDKNAISNSSKTKLVTKHPLKMEDGRTPIRYWSHDRIKV